MNKKYVDLNEILLALPKSATKIIEDWPAADVREVQRGKWEDVSESAVIPSGKCSVCGKYNRITNYCPNCGADMREEQT